MSLNIVSSSHLPERVLLILLELEHGPLPAATLKRKIEQSYDILIEPGAFYKTLTSLERKGWIELADTSASLHPHTYCLTERGQAMLHQHRALASHRRERIPTTGGNTSLRGGIMKLATWLVKLYPRAWRERYEVEMLALLEDHQITFLTICDLLFGVVDARLDPHYRTERDLLAFKNTRIATLALLAMLTAFLFLVQVNMFVIMQGITILFGSGPTVHNPYAYLNVIALMIDPIYGLLCLITLLVFFSSMRRFVASRHVGKALFAAVCFVIPIIITLLPNTLIPANSVSFIMMFHQPLMLWMEMELLMGVVFLTILKGKQAIATRRKGLLFFVILIDALLVLRGVEFLFQLPISTYTPSLWAPLFAFTLLASSLSPLSLVGVLLLMLVGSKFNQWIKRFALVTAGLAAPIILANLLFFLVGSWNSWMHPVSIWTISGPTYGLFIDQLPIGIAGIGLLFCTLLALAAFRSLLLALKRTPVTKVAMQELPPMEMRQ